MTHKPLILIILDGFGFRSNPKHNAIAAAKTPFLDFAMQNFPNCLIATSGEAVGLPAGQMGNSEVGHMNLGAGRIVYQDFTRITKSIKDGDFFTNPILCDAITSANNNNAAIHIMGLISDGGVHSHIDHIIAILQLAKQKHSNNIYLHAFLDGRDTSPKSAKTYLHKLQNACTKLKTGKIISIIGRYYAMDRDNRWERVKEAYNLISQGKAKYHFADIDNAIDAAYERGETDEFIQATTIGNKITINDGDILIFMNFRADRARELTKCFIENDFAEFDVNHNPNKIKFITLTQYAKDFAIDAAFMPQILTNTLAEYLSVNHKTQLRIAETEKYAHVTFFFSGGIEQPYFGEQRVLIPSPQIATYDLQPQMSAIEVTNHIITAIEEQSFDVIIANFANCDMVGHTGNFTAAVKAVETIDECLQRIHTSLIKFDGEALITADHGNVEQMFDETTNQPHTAHTTEPVPLIYLGKRPFITRNNASLSDIAPTLLKLLDLPKPEEMTGSNILLNPT